MSFFNKEDKNEQVESSWENSFDSAYRDATSRRNKTRQSSKKNESPNPEVKQLQDIADQLSKPEYWKALVRAPADYMLAKTGHGHWNISEQETNTLATTGSLVARSFLTIDPRYIALILFFTNATFIYGTRMLQEIRLTRQEQAEQNEQNNGKKT